MNIKHSGQLLYRCFKQLEKKQSVDLLQSIDYNRCTALVTAKIRVN